MLLAQDEAALYQLAARYARAVDRNEPDVIAELFTADAVIVGPGFEIKGIQAIQSIPGMLSARYRKTLHVLHQQTATVAGDSASGETHCTANHISKDEPASNLVWAIRYQDRFRREQGQWRFSRRQLDIDWTETRPVQTDSQKEPT